MMGIVIAAVAGEDDTGGGEGTCSSMDGWSSLSLSSSSSSLSSISFQLFVLSLIVLSLPTLFWLVSYSIPQMYMMFVRSVPNLKERYKGCEWALVTGAGSGIGRSLAFKLASQGLNVVLVSLEDDCFQQTMKDIKKEYPNQEFRSIGCTFAPGSKYMEQIQEGTKDICIRIVFNNAGFIVTGFLDQTPIEKLLVNIECNATANVNVAHYFVQKMVKQQQTGCIVFTSSVAGFIPTPFAAMYASTKAFVSQFASCLHIEVQSLGIDVCAVHPSPVASNFYDKLDHKVDMIEAAAKTAVSPDALPNEIFKSIGCCALRDIGGMAFGTRMGTFFLPYNFFSQLFATIAPYMPDWKTHNKTRFD